MSDSFKNDIVEVDYVAGEQPTHIKLEAASEQLRVALQRLGGAVGDVFTQQIHSGSSGTYDLASLSTAGPNLNRLIGSAGWLNPGTFGRTLVTKAVTFVGHQSVDTDPPTVYGFSHYNRREFKLPDPPIVFSSTEGAETVALGYSYNLGASYWTLSGAQAPSTLVASLNLLNATGEYYVSPDGVITLFDPLANGETFTVTYQFHPLPEAYDGASLNVIPDFSQTGTLCTVALVSGSIYSITLPTYTGKRSWGTLSSWSPPDEFYTYNNAASNQHPNLNQQLLLPTILRSNLSAGDIVPSGFVQLWDETTGTIVEGLEFTYQSTSVLHCSGVTLTASSNRYRLIVPGTNTNRTVHSLKENYRWHDHSGRVTATDGKHLGHRIHHYDLLNLIDEGDGGSNSDGFVISQAGVTRNPHPQYFHRYGWQYGNSVSDAGNIHNAFLGELVISGDDETFDISADSYKLCFSGPSSVAPYLFFDQDEDILRLETKGLRIEEEIVKGSAPSSKGVYGNSIIAAHGEIATDGAEGYTVTEGFNISTAQSSSNDIRVNFQVNLNSDGYVVVSSMDASSGAYYVVKPLQRFVNYIVFRVFDVSDGSTVDLSSTSVIFYFIITGNRA